jgi:hypothetical protein
VNALSRTILKKERSLIEYNASEDRIQELLKSAEAKLVVNLREIAKKLQVLDASTSFKVLPTRVPNTGASEPPAKKQRVEEEEDGTGMEETEYQYNVSHMLTLESYLHISSPGAGFIEIELKVPGAMKGTFLSIESDAEQLTDVMIEVNTDILAAMIEKSSRMVVRSSVEALLKAEQEKDTEEATKEKREKVASPTFTPAIPTFTPKRKYSDERVSGLVVVTPRDTSSPSSFEDSDCDDKPVLLSIPDNFCGQPKTTLRMLTPQPSRARDGDNIPFTARLPRKKERPLPYVVTPHKTSRLYVEARGKGPNLPVLVEVACAAMRNN